MPKNLFVQVRSTKLPNDPDYWYVDVEIAEETRAEEIKLACDEIFESFDVYSYHNIGEKISYLEVQKILNEYMDLSDEEKELITFDNPEYPFMTLPRHFEYDGEFVLWFE